MRVEPLIFELSKPGRTGTSVPDLDVPEAPLPVEHLRDDLPLPEVSEIDVVRHFTRLSQLNHAVDIDFYPLGSCTMKYNPKINELVARFPGFAHLHPLQDPRSVQGILRLMYELQGFLAEIAGFDAVSLQPAAGAHGELTGILIARAYFDAAANTSAGPSSSRIRHTAPIQPPQPWPDSGSSKSSRMRVAMWISNSCGSSSGRTPQRS